MLTFAKYLLLLTILSMLLSGPRLDRYHDRCLSYCADGDKACIAACDTAAGR